VKKLRLKTLIGLSLLLAIAGCGEDFLQMEYDDLDDATRVWVDASGENPLQLSALFVCAGDNLCTPDSVLFTVTLLLPVCPSDAITWSPGDSIFYTCGTVEVDIMVGPSMKLPLPPTEIWGEQVPGDIFGPDVVFETFYFDLPYSDVQRIARAGTMMEFWISSAGGWTGRRSIGSIGTWGIQQLVSVIEDESDPDAQPWDSSVSADYDTESDETTLQALLPSSPERDLRGWGISSLEGRCPGRGWCRYPALTFRVGVEDSTHLSLNLADIEFVLDDSLVWAPQFVEFSKQGKFGSVVLETLPDDLEKLVGSSAAQLRLDTLAADLTEDQFSVLRRFWQRIADSGTPITPP
jgi:hypothetical protein